MNPLSRMYWVLSLVHLNKDLLAFDVGWISCINSGVGERFVEYGRQIYFLCNLVVSRCGVFAGGVNKLC